MLQIWRFQLTYIIVTFERCNRIPSSLKYLFSATLQTSVFTLRSESSLNRTELDLLFVQLEISNGMILAPYSASKL